MKSIGQQHHNQPGTGYRCEGGGAAVPASRTPSSDTSEEVEPVVVVGVSVTLGDEDDKQRPNLSAEQKEDTGGA